MFAELAKVMDYAVADDSYLDSLKQNVAGKRTKANQDNATDNMKQLYLFDKSFGDFECFKQLLKIGGVNLLPPHIMVPTQRFYFESK